MSKFDINAEIQSRLKMAQKSTDLPNEHKEILCSVIEMELKGDLTGSYSDIPVQVYHHPLCSGYSSTTLKRILEQSYNHWFISKTEESQSLRFGSAFHAFCNEPEVFSREYIICPEDDKKSAIYKEYKRKAEKGAIVLSRSEFKTIEVMSKKLFDHPDSSKLLKNSKSEVSFFSQDTETGLWKKCRVDSIKGRSVSDLKTTVNASPLSFARDARKFLYRISASYYLEIISEVMNELHKDFYLIPCEKVDPYEVAVYRVSDHSIEQAQSEIRTALRTIKNILDQGENAWRGYSLGVKEIAI